MRISAWWRQWWTDPRLAWDATNATRLLHFSPSEVWTPDVAAFERAQSDGESGSSSVTLSDSVQCTHRGACYHVVPQTTTFPCNMGFDQFPFDRQLCHIRIGGWAHDRCAQDVLPRPINCTAGSSSASAAIATATGDGLPYQWSWPAGGASCDAWRFVDIVDYKPHHEFELREVHVKWTQSSFGGGGASYPYVSLTFDLQRAALSYVYAVLLPLLFVTVLSFFTLCSTRRQRRGDGGEYRAAPPTASSGSHRSSTTSRPSSPDGLRHLHRGDLRPPVQHGVGAPLVANATERDWTLGSAGRAAPPNTIRWSGLYFRSTCLCLVHQPCSCTGS